MASMPETSRTPQENCKPSWASPTQGSAHSAAVPHKGNARERAYAEAAMCRVERCLKLHLSDIRKNPLLCNDFIGLGQTIGAGWISLATVDRRMDQTFLGAGWIGYSTPGMISAMRSKLSELVAEGISKPRKPMEITPRETWAQVCANNCGNSPEPRRGEGKPWFDASKIGPK